MVGHTPTREDDPMPNRRRTSRRPVTPLLAVACLLVFGTAGAADTWAWFAEPFSVEVATMHPEAGAMEGTIVVDATAVRTEWRFAGMEQVVVARPEGEGVRLSMLVPGAGVQEVLLSGADAFEHLVHGYVAAVTAPEDPRHPCTRSPETHRCTFEGDETVDGRDLERWRIDASARDGSSRGQWFWFDRAAGLVVAALDDTGAELTFSDHRRGPVDPAAFELP